MRRTKKHILFLVTFSLLLHSCASYTTFVQVEPRKDVPPGSKEILLFAPLPELLAVFKEEGILYTYKEGGVETEEIMLTEGLRAKYTVAEYEGAVKIIPYSGITDKARQNVALWAGYAAASTYTNEMSRIVYPKTGSHMAFDYAVQLALRAGDIEYR